MTVTRGHPEMGPDQVRCPLTCDDARGVCGFDSRHLHLFAWVTNYWDTDSAGRAAPLGLAPAEMVGALFYNFAPGEVARHIPKVWRAWNETATRANRHLGIAGGVGTASEHTVADDTVLDLISSQHHALEERPDLRPIPRGRVPGEHKDVEPTGKVERRPTPVRSIRKVVRREPVESEVGRTGTTMRLAAPGVRSKRRCAPLWGPAGRARERSVR